ncbi:GtrA family protein [Candidatus Venteria ishoeyi]|uniref:GtrA family protein n=1 Tax=Candidatus Venteria ishoeyi TaxID=1899563 RepID=UPI0025A5679E|nr:GtrA family protein [Candidatus Venteria ishoeyi]MDM8548356.1 GtrA family protein [Candidatus Venteria ishoeyi]
MSNLKHDFFHPVFYKFVLVSGFAALVNFFSRIALSLFMQYAAAIVLAYLIGMITAFSLNRLLVFETARHGHVHHQFYWFTLINIAAILQTLIVSLLLARMILPGLGITYWVEEVAHFIGICVPVLSSFLGHKYITFKK